MNNDIAIEWIATHHSIDIGDADPELVHTYGDGPFRVVFVRREGDTSQPHLLNILHSES